MKASNDLQGLRLTVFTPAYNRAHTLPRLYQSLCGQTCKDFCWLVVDDGSQDETTRLLAQWQAEAPFCVDYVSQENRGMHAAHNTAYARIATELNVCVDSDDAMPANAVEMILTLWRGSKKEERVAGLLGLDVDMQTGQTVGTAFPAGLARARMYDVYYKHGVRGDKKVVLRTELARRFPYPEFCGEKYIGLNLKYLQLDQTHEWLCRNVPLCRVEYLPDGSSRNMWRQYRRNPRGFLHYRMVLLRLPFAGFKFKLRQLAHVPLEAIFFLAKKIEGLFRHVSSV
ncbi:MAG: glycosyltransferase family 2 protein [Oscillospiraceae bacterium]|jgi:glycosyltransferase involved in cell wall biosynthesis|nr:glycosyltransferase family 2 protein [Oscillospiraceae bacterium]